MVYVDFVLCDYMDDMVVVGGDVCCCCAHDNCGDLLVLGKCMVVCYAVWPSGVCVF